MLSCPATCRTIRTRHPQHTCSTAALQLSTTHLTAVDTEEVEQPTVPSTHYCPSPSSSHTFKLSLCRKMLSVAPQPCCCCCCPQLGEDAMIITLPPQPRDTQTSHRQLRESDRDQIFIIIKNFDQISMKVSLQLLGTWGSQTVSRQSEVSSCSDEGPD